MDKSLAYLGAPYSSPDPKIRQFRIHAATFFAYNLFKEGQLVFSPLTHNNPIDKLGFFGDFKTWLEFDHHMLLKCNKLIILKLPDWEESKGLKAEIELAKRNNILIEEINPSEELLNKISITLDNSSNLKLLWSELEKMIEERDWKQFHSPKNLAMSLQSEATEVLDHFIWVTEEQSANLLPHKKQEIADELGDVLINLVHISNSLGIDLIPAAFQKLEKIKNKYPVELVKGKAYKDQYK